VAASNRELREAVRAGDFRRDLYYRLNVLSIHLPPLRERREDIPILVRRFVSEFSRTHDREFRGLTPEALDILLAYQWPGNVRELRNLIESMVVLAPGSVIRPEDIPAEIRAGRGTSLLPAKATLPALPEGAAGDTASATQLEFVFRTLVALKVDVDELKREFEAYKERGTLEVPERWAGQTIEFPDPGEWSALEGARAGHPHRVSVPTLEEEEEGEGTDGSISFRPGMTMAELEREAIVATLRVVDGNRRKAAEKLGIGERTLYRKIKQYEIEL